jgi:beta-lactamase class A
MKVHSRRDFLADVAATAAMGATASGQAAASSNHGHASWLAADVIAPFHALPGRKAIKFWAPGKHRQREFLATLNPELRLFCGSSFKAFVLCEILRQLDAPDVGSRLATEQLALNESVWSISSPVFNPPLLAGKVSLRTTLEAMISHSDNTGTDMALHLAGVDRVRKLIADIGLTDTFIPNSTRQFFGYVFGASNWPTMTWDELAALIASGPTLAHPVLNDTQTMASTPNDFVSFYSRALHGEFFRYPQTLFEFRAILTTAEDIARVIPLGVSAFVKGGSITASPYHVLSVAGGMFFDGRWVYFSAMFNWENDSASDPETASAIVSVTQEAFNKIVRGLSD